MFENKYIQQRIEKADKLREVGINPYSNESSRNCTVSKYLCLYLNSLSWIPWYFSGSGEIAFVSIFKSSAWSDNSPWPVTNG